MLKRILTISSTVLLSMSLVACAGGPRYYAGGGGGGYHDGGYGGRYERVCSNCGTVRDIDQLWVEDRDIGAGAVLGAIIGGVVGSNVGSGSGRRAATAAGAIAGGVIGHQAEHRNADMERVYRFEVRLDDGRWAQVTQQANPGLRIGDRVEIRGDRLYPLS